MRKRSSLIFIGSLALGLILSFGILRAASNHPSRSGRKPDAEVQARMREAARVAEVLENLALRAFALSRIASGLNRVDPAEARQVAEQAWKTARQIDSASYRNFVINLESRARAWERNEREKIGPLLERIERTRSRGWLLGVIAADMRAIDPAWAEEILEKAIEKSEAVRDQPGRDFDLRALGAEMAKRDRERAIAVAGKIRDPQVKSWALRAIASEIAPSDPAGAATVWRMAIAEAERIPDVIPSEIDGIPRLVSTSPEARQNLLRSEKTRRAAARAQILGKIAIEIRRIDPEMSGSLFHRAIQLAEGIEKPYTRAYTLSEIAGALAPVEPAKAAEIAARIGKPYADARFAAWMAIASRTSAQGDWEKAVAAAREIEERYDRAKAFGTVASALAPRNPARARALVRQIEVPYLRDEALSGLALKWPGNHPEERLDLVEGIQDPFIRSRTFKEIATQFAQKNESEKAEKLFARATSLAEEIRSSVLRWEIAVAWTKINPDRFYEVVGSVDGDDAHRSAALREIALDRWKSDRLGAEMALEMAVKTAEQVDDAYERSELLRKIAEGWARVDRVKAEAIFRKAVEAARRIGMTG